MSLITKAPFGQFNGQPVDLFSLSNNSGMVLKVMTYGATITSLQVPSANDEIDDVVCGFDTFDEYFADEYVANSPYFGCAVGRYAARIKDGKFMVNNHQYAVATNDGPNHLHGGVVGFDKQVWNATTYETDAGVGIRLSLTSSDGDEGYPGNLEVEVDYCLTHDNALLINYKGKSDQDTPLSLTNHSYFNLTGFKSDIKDHELQLAASEFLLPDDTNVPVGHVASVGSITDFTAQRSLRSAFNDLENGFEHYYVFDDQSHTLREVACVYEPTSGRKMVVKTTEPGTLFYTGFYTSDALKRSENVRFGQFRALCLETSKYPNGPNISGSPRSVTAAGETYRETTEFQFSW